MSLTQRANCPRAQEMGQIVRPAAGGAGSRCYIPGLLRRPRKLYELLEPGQQTSPWEQVFHMLVLAMILASGGVVALQAPPKLALPKLAVQEWCLSGVERYAVSFFSVEYLARLWNGAEASRFGDRSRGRLRCRVSPRALVDLTGGDPALLSGAFCPCQHRGFPAAAGPPAGARAEVGPVSLLANW